MERMYPVITPEYLRELTDTPGFVLVDARTGAFAKENFKAVHLKNAVFADIDEDLADTKGDPAQGGRHPLPDIKNFVSFLGRIGIGPETHVVVYDDKGGANAAARFWWMMRALGHEKIQVLSGGLQAALSNSVELSTTETQVVEKPPYPAEKWLLPLVNIEEVARAAADPEYLVIDVREAFRYRGESEPIDKVAGHIPGAHNVPYTHNLDENQSFLPQVVLQRKFTNILNGKDPNKVIVHCGSGVTACHTALAMEMAGFPVPALYVGSWSEWSRNDRPVGKSTGIPTQFF